MALSCCFRGAPTAGYVSAHRCCEHPQSVSTNCVCFPRSLSRSQGKQVQAGLAERAAAIRGRSRAPATLARGQGAPRGSSASLAMQEEQAGREFLLLIMTELHPFRAVLLSLCFQLPLDIHTLDIHTPLLKVCLFCNHSCSPTKYLQ